ncbi:tRNA (adenosine(37)-N6)-threonylcarbamoyltransferase complex dimerization subunit type 1 TsaB [Candidatus Peregrinibacteria bacterium]|nr:tRNA (adenosine(37)-N6)-threonylcarbamoyltransferase complex dimerization subunit type 1 TsaB [Candidatus Peregrinibacteria bacterium]
MILCVDTTTSAAGITLVDLKAGKTHYHGFADLLEASETILKLIDGVLKTAKASPADLMGVMAIIGPGSFTGLRIGITVANQFAHQLNIPIAGLRTDEWWRYRTDERAFVHLQTMNRNEVYAERKIIPVAGLPTKKTKWLGDVTELQRVELPEKYEEILGLRSPEITWKLVAEDRPLARQKTYDLLEPWYGKEPTITKSKKTPAIR